MHVIQRLKGTLLFSCVLGVAVGAVLGGYVLYVRYCVSESHDTLIPQPGGSLIVCGGGPLPEEIFERFVQIAGNRQARLVIIPSYDPSPQDVAELNQFWRGFKVASVHVLHAASRQECEDPEFVQPLREATGVWLTGGRQTHLSERYVDTEVERQLRALLDREGVIGGASAGAAAMTRVMIGGGVSEAEQSQGFDLLPGTIIDQHFLYRNRLQRLLGVLESHPGLVGLGIDESTAVLVRRNGQYWTVLGKSYAVVCLPQKGELPRIEILKSDDRIDIEILKRRPGAYAIDSPAALDRFLGAEKQ